MIKENTKMKEHLIELDNLRVKVEAAGASFVSNKKLERMLRRMSDLNSRIIPECLMGNKSHQGLRPSKRFYFARA